MKTPIFITGNPYKAAFLSRNLGIELEHRALDVPEIQSLDIAEVVTAKAKAAYEEVGSLVLVDDASLSFNSLGRLPGVMVKWFENEIGLERMCRLLDPFDDRSAVHQVVYCLYDGKTATLFEGTTQGRVPAHPQGGKGFGFDPIYIQAGMNQSRAELSEEEQDRLSARYEAMQKLRSYLETQKN